MSQGDADEIEALIIQAGLGSQDAFSRLYDATSGQLLAVSLRVLSERAAAEDAMQEAYVKIWNNANRYKVTGHSPMSWLVTIVRNTAIDRLRARKLDRDIDDYSDRIASAEPSAEDTVIAESEARRIVACMKELETDRRAAISGAYLEGKSYKDLSSQFDVPLNTMRAWLRRGLAALRECMAR